MATANEASTALSTYLASRNLPPSAEWLQSLIPTLRLNTPMVALQKTALFRILATDLMTSINKSQVQTFPNGTTDPSFQEKQLRGTITVQILDIEDIGNSRWSQVEALESQARGETTRGREVIRVLPDENEQDSTTAPTTASGSKPGPHKLLLQDANGSKVYAVEYFTVPGINVQTSIGAKLLLKDCTVARGVILMDSRSVEFLGGKVDSWDKTWREGRKEALKTKAGMS